MAKPNSSDNADQLQQLRGVIESCDFLLPVAQATAKPGNAPEIVAAWLIALRANACTHIANGGMGAMAPMATKVVDRQSDQSRT